MRVLRVLGHAATAVFALLAAPAAMMLLSMGGYGVYQGVLTRSGPLTDPLSLLFMALGVLLIASIAITGLWSSVGLLAMAIPAAGVLVLSIFPRIYWELYMALLGWVPERSLDILPYGAPHVPFTLLTAFGIVLVISRRRPASSIVLGVLGTLVVPVVQLLGVALVILGVGLGTLHSVQTMQPRISVLALALILAGMVLILLSTLGAHLAPYALILPALPLMALNALAMLPAGADLYLTVATSLHPQMFMFVTNFMVFGGGATADVLLLTFTDVLAVVRLRARSRISRRALAEQLPITSPSPVGAGASWDPAGALPKPLDPTLELTAEEGDPAPGPDIPTRPGPSRPSEGAPSPTEGPGR